MKIYSQLHPSGDDLVDALYDATKLVAALILEANLEHDAVLMLYRVHGRLAETYLCEAERNHQQLVESNAKLRREIAIVDAMRGPAAGQVS
jgi:hypothetical protein